MKKYITVLLSLTLVLLLSGCVKANFHFTVNKDGSVNATHKVGMDSSLLAFIQNPSDNPIEQFKQVAQENGFTVKQYKEDKYTGIEVTKHVTNPGEEMMLGNGAFDVKYDQTKGFFFNTYRVNGKIDLTNGEKPQDETEQQMQKAMESQMDLKMAITLPVKAEQHNATRTIGENNRTYEWDLLPSQVNEIDLTVKLINMLNVIIVAGIALAVVIAAIALVVKRRKANVATDMQGL